MTELEVRTDNEFWRLYHDALPQVYGYLVRRADTAVAEDLTQEVFTSAARAWSGNSVTITVPWLLTVAKSRLVDHYRSEQRRTRNLVSAWSARPDTVAASAEDSAAARRLAPTTEAALAAMPDAQRVALVLHHLDDLSVADVAEMMGRSVHATESLLVRARASFEQAFEGADR
jgi:RNA polymerase sigma-70 factor (ECF subfamily)